MKSFRFKKIDAFTGANSPGNPAGCVYPDHPSDVSAAEMQEIARQLKGFVSEVAYIFPEGDGFFLKYYSSEREVDFCGHATIAAMVDIFSGEGVWKSRSSAVLRVGESRLTVRNEIGTCGCVFIAAPPPRFLPMGIQTDDVARALGLALADIDGKYPLSLVNSGLNSLLVPMRRASTLTDVTPGFEALTDFCVAGGIDIVVVFTDDRILPGSSYRTRVFAPRFGYLEDPATGSGNAALGCMLAKHGFWKDGELTIEQGRSYKSPNIVKLRIAEPGDKPRVLFGGGATVRIDGTYILHDV